MLKEWKTLSSRVLMRNPYWSYFIDEFEIEEGKRGEYHYVHTPGSTIVIPFINENTLLLVKQYRYLNKRMSIEFPCGGTKPELSPLENAIKELREETGYTAGVMIPVGTFSPFTGAADEMCSVFIGKDLRQSPLPQDFTEEFELLTVSIEQTRIMIHSNEIWDGLSLAAWSLAQNYLSENLFTKT